MVRVLQVRIERIHKLAHITPRLVELVKHSSSIRLDLHSVPLQALVLDVIQCFDFDNLRLGED